MFEQSTSDARQEPVDGHRCKSGAGKCWGTTLDNAGTKHAGITTSLPFCEKCLPHIWRVIAHLHDDWDALAVLISEHASTQAAKVSYTPDPGILINTGAEAKQVQILELVDLAADMITATTDTEYSPAKRGRDHLITGQELIAHNIETLLAAQPEWVLRWDRSGEVTGETPTTWNKPAPKTYVGYDAQGDELDGRGHRYTEMSGADIILELWTLHDSIRAHYGGRRRDMRKHYPMPCYTCGKRSLYREYGQELIRCTNCPPNSQGGRGWTEDDYNRLAGFTRFHLKVIQESTADETKSAAQQVKSAP